MYDEISSLLSTNRISTYSCNSNKSRMWSWARQHFESAFGSTSFSFLCTFRTGTFQTPGYLHGEYPSLTDIPPMSVSESLHVPDFSGHWPSLPISISGTLNP